MGAAKGVKQKRKAKETSETVVMKSLRLQQIILTIAGDSPLITNNFWWKKIQEMLDKQSGKAVVKTKKIPEDDYIGATYYIDDAGNELGGVPTDLSDLNKAAKEFLAARRKIKKPKFGFPANGIKQCAVRGAKSLGYTMTDMRGAFHITRSLVEIHGHRTMRCDMARVGMGIADVRFRPEFRDWWAQLPITYNANMVTPDLLVNMFNTGGFSCGIGEWRPSSKAGGSNGMFHVVSEQEVKALRNKL